MASLTVEELKKALTESGIEVPTGRGIKKDDLVKLYDKHLVMNDSVGAVYSSDDEESKTTNGEQNWKQIREIIESLPSDDLYSKMKELGIAVGPILPNTRKVYENKCIKYLQQQNANGFNVADETMQMDPLEVSDNENDLLTPPPQAPPKRAPSREPSSSKENLPPPRRFSYIEKISPGSSQRLVEPLDSLDSYSTVRQRTTGNKGGEEYVGKWSPHLSSRKITPAVAKPAVAKSNKWKYVLLAVLVIGSVALSAFAYQSWRSNDPYKMIEDEAEEVTAHNV